jgi:hypothetical protein
LIWFDLAISQAYPSGEEEAGVIPRSNDFHLPSLREEEEGGGSAPCAYSVVYSINICILCAEETGQPTALWTVTWEKIDTFLPHLKQVSVGKPIRIEIQYLASMRIQIPGICQNTKNLNFYASFYFLKYFHHFHR